MMDPIKGERNMDVRVTLEYKRSRAFINKHASSRAALYSRSRISSLNKVKTRQFQNSRYFEYSIERANGPSRIINSADFHRMNSADLRDLARICRHRAETKLEMKYYHLALRDIINAIIFDFGYKDAELHPLFNTAPPLPEPNTSFEGIGDISRSYSLEPICALAYEEDQPEEGKSPQLLCFRLEEKHLYPSEFLQNFVITLEEDEDMEAADRDSLLGELKWFLAVRKHWRALLRFIDNE